MATKTNPSSESDVAELGAGVSFAGVGSIFPTCGAIDTDFEANFFFFQCLTSKPLNASYSIGQKQFG